MTRVVLFALLSILLLGIPVLYNAQGDSDLKATDSGWISVTGVEMEKTPRTELPAAIVKAVRQANVSIYDEGSVASLDIDLSSYEQAIMDELSRSHVDEKCGDRMQTESIAFMPAEDHLDVQAKVKLMRYICIEMPTLIYKGIVPKLIVTKAPAKIFSKTFPLVFQLMPQITQDGYEFDSDWINADTDYPMEADLVGRWESFNKIGDELNATVLEATILAWKTALKEAQELRKGEAVVLDYVTFLRDQDGTLKLKAGFK